MSPERTDATRLEMDATFRAVFDGLPDAAVLADANRRIRLVNPAFKAQFGVTGDKVVGRTTKFIYADPQDFVDLGLTRLASMVSEAPTVFEMRCRRWDGSLFWAESTMMRVLDESGNLLAKFGLHRDIAQRKRAEQALNQARNQLTAFIDRAPHCIAMFDRQMNYLATSREWLRTYGNGETALVGRNNYLLNPVVPQHWRDAHATGLEGTATRNHAARGDAAAPLRHPAEHEDDLPAPWHPRQRGAPAPGDGGRPDWSDRHRGTRARCARRAAHVEPALRRRGTPAPRRATRLPGEDVAAGRPRSRLPT